jgi:2-phosphosulfolactate phosphatase
MDIVIGSLREGAERATGNVAVIDVFRAFTTAAVALANGAAKIVMVGAVDEALALKAAGIGHLCIGETNGLPIPEFDFGNSPFAVSQVDFQGKTLIQRTSAGTQGIVALVTAGATARALAAGDPECISLAAMGENTLIRADEDELCAIHLRNLLQGRPGDPDAVLRLILAGSEAARFRNPALPHFHPADLEIALDIDRYDFAIRVEMENGRPVGRMERAG